MNRDEVLRLAKECGHPMPEADGDFLENFAALLSQAPQEVSANDIVRSFNAWSPAQPQQPASQQALSDELENLIGQYWEIAYSEGRSGGSRGDDANEVLHKIRALLSHTAPQAERIEREFNTVMDALGCDDAKTAVEIISSLRTSQPMELFGYASVSVGGHVVFFREDPKGLRAGWDGLLKIHELYKSRSDQADSSPVSAPAVHKREWPARIWLQHDEDCMGFEQSCIDEASWCADQINPTDIAYVRADLAALTRPEPAVSETERDLNLLQSCADWLSTRSRAVWAKGFEYSSLMQHYAKRLLEIRAAIALTRPGPAAPVRKTCLGCLYGLPVKDGKHTHASGIYAGDCVEPAAQSADKDAEKREFYCGVIAALGALRPHSTHGDTLHDEIVKSVGKETLYGYAEPEDVEWAGLDPEYYAALAQQAEGGKQS